MWSAVESIEVSAFPLEYLAAVEVEDPVPGSGVCRIFPLTYPLSSWRVDGVRSGVGVDEGRVVGVSPSGLQLSLC